MPGRSMMFQSTLPRGERPPNSVMTNDTMPFQSTLPRGERPSLLAVNRPAVSFNPRSREGSDDARDVCPCCGDGFQSTLPRGERLQRVVGIAVADDVSIHAPARGAT